VIKYVSIQQSTKSERNRRTPVEEQYHGERESVDPGGVAFNLWVKIGYPFD